jgi:transcriptional regulator with XRE-family HTH domain
MSAMVHPMKALVEYMKVTGLSQVDLAKRIGVDQGQLNHWLRGRRSPSAENLKRIAERTGVSLEKLVADL